MRSLKASLSVPGRGSAAGCLVSYVLGITNIDPLKYGLMFERFLNPERQSSPDIDLDFPDNRRDEIIAYVRRKYGEDHVAQIVTFGTLQARAAVRDSGRVLKIDPALVDRVAKLIPMKMSLEEALEFSLELRQLYETDEQIRRWLDTAKAIEGLARHASTHPCGVVIGSQPLIELVPLQRGSRRRSHHSIRWSVSRKSWVGKNGLSRSAQLNHHRSNRRTREGN
jgi:DNA polymerase-3 subunit alpha